MVEVWCGECNIRYEDDGDGFYHCPECNSHVHLVKPRKHPRRPEEKPCPGCEEKVIDICKKIIDRWLMLINTWDTGDYYKCGCTIMELAKLINYKAPDAPPTDKW